MALLGRILNVDLSEGKWTLTPFPEAQAERFLGGRGFNVWFLYHTIPPGTDPMGSENVLMFSCGLLTGTTAPTSSRLHVNGLSPLTGLLGSSNVGGYFGAKLRSCGIQCLIIRGRSSQPVYLCIDDDTVKIINATFLWGLDTWETEERLKKELSDDRSEIMAIGPGGEKGVLFACIMTDRDHAAGRTGMGAVMGSKNLKAIVIKGGNQRTTTTASNGHEAFQRYIRQIKNSSDFKTFAMYGGAGYVKWADQMGILATRNYRKNRFEAVDCIDGKRLKKYIIRSRGCYRCPVQCKAELQFNHGKFKGTKLFRPEFEPMVNLGSKCGLSDLETLVYLDNLCSRLGIDSISAGSAIAFAMDLFQRKILTLEDTGGTDLSWGSGHAMETLIRQMAYQEGLGAILSQGVRRTAEIIGRGSQRFAPHVKGLELTAYHPYSIMGTALGYTVANRGGDFNDIYATLEYRWPRQKAAKEFGTPSAVDLDVIYGKAAMVRRAMIIVAVLDSLGLCKVPALSLICNFDLEHEAEMTSALTSFAVNAKKLFEVGERIINLERLFNMRHGASSADDCLPDMFFNKEYTPKGEPSELHRWMEPMKQEFYKVMGWDEQGHPCEKELKELGET